MTTAANVPRVSANQSNDNENDLVSHGTVYDDVKYPYIIYVRGTSSLCTGSLIQPLFVLTAAHCSWGMAAKDLKMTSEWKGFDSFAVIGGTPEEFANGRTVNCVVIGFGQREGPQAAKWNGFQTDVVAGYGPNACAKPLPGGGWKNYICAKPNKKSVCQGDSGGPLICNDKLYGTVKDGYNFKYFNKTICGDPNVQTRHIFLYWHREWIDKITNGQNEYYDDYFDNAPTNRQYFTIVAFFAILSLSGQVVFFSI
ncbi:kallikrein-6-like [Adelges cooleyi]|uniref:kallikrein-6-like n=1 Tax=Adelges cooleyi TaxID=133065 RepID=UPI00217F5A5F|nr:kallikrein-6-like [Adelges cooleyi]